MEENQLTANDWDVLEHLAKLLGFYEDAVKTLEGDGQQRRRKQGWVGSYGNAWEVIQGFEFLLEVLEDYKQLASEISDAEHFRININLVDADLLHGFSVAPGFPMGIFRE